MANYNPPKLTINEDFELPEVDCSYYSPLNLKKAITECRDPIFSIFALNIRSCRKNFSSLLSFLSTFMLRFTIIVLLETWLSNDFDDTFNITGYKQLNIYRNNHGGGIKMFYDENFSVDLLQEITFVDNLMEILSFYITGHNCKYLISCVYKPPSVNSLVFNDQFLSRVLSKLSSNENIIFVGDFNLNLYNPLKLRCIDEFVNNFLSFDYFPVINLPAMFNPNNPITKFSIIDQIWTNFKRGCNHTSGIVDFLITDHLPLFYFFTNYDKLPTKIIKFRQVNDVNSVTFNEAVNDTDFSEIFEINDPNTAFNVFYSKLFSLYNSCFPIKTKKL